MGWFNREPLTIRASNTLNTGLESLLEQFTELEKYILQGKEFYDKAKKIPGAIDNLKLKILKANEYVDSLPLSPQKSEYMNQYAVFIVATGGIVESVTNMKKWDWKNVPGRQINEEYSIMRNTFSKMYRSGKSMARMLKSIKS
jgi:type II restriction/modification system DNA methylase subunit YeeA